MPPVVGCRRAERVLVLLGSASKPEGVTRCRKARAPGPRKVRWTMWLTSKREAWERVKACEAETEREAYWTGI